MITRRDFLTAAAIGLGGTSFTGNAWGRDPLTQDGLLAFEPYGNATILHVADLHAQLVPLYFREPSINLGIAAAKNLPPHLTDAAFRTWFKIAQATPEAYALTSDDFVGLARDYGRMGGIDRIATIVKSIRGARGSDRVLLLDGGDSWQGSWTSLKTRGGDMAEIMSALGVDAMTGHWEFTYGTARVKELIATLGFPLLAQNIRDSEWQEKVFPATKMFERGGARIAVIGQAFPYTPIANPRWMMAEWEFGLHEEALKAEVDAARAGGADAVVLLSHNGTDVDLKLASRIDGIDIILTSHTHDATPDVMTVGKTILIASGSHGKFVSRLDIDAGGGRMHGFRFKLIPVFSDVITPDPAMSALAARLRAPYAADLARELGRTDDLLYRRGNFNGTFDDLIAGAILKERDAEIALSPGFRWGGTLLPGDAITFEALTNATAITYPACYRNEMTGADLHALLEDVADNLFNPDPYLQSGGDMVRAAGLGYRIDVSKPIGQRISAMTHMGSGKPIDASRRYVVAGWGSVVEGVSGPPVWDLVAAHVGREKTIRLQPNHAVEIVTSG